MLLQPLMDMMSHQQIPNATLYVIGTPIGNICDISLRALAILDAADVVACEDTRNTRALLNAYQLTKPLIAAHQHNEREAAQQLIARLEKGERVALVSDAGTPAVSDPGAKIVDSVRCAGYRVVPVPGPSAGITALSASGFSDDRFMFIGFLPVKNTQRLEVLQQLRKIPAALIFYEAPHRIMDMLKALNQIFEPERQIMISRELTKLFEETWRGTLSSVEEWMIADNNRSKGEFVILIEGAKAKENQEDEASKKVLSVLLEVLPVSAAVATAVKLTGKKKNHLYDLALHLKESSVI